VNVGSEQKERKGRKDNIHNLLSYEELKHNKERKETE